MDLEVGSFRCANWGLHVVQQGVIPLATGKKYKNLTKPPESWLTTLFAHFPFTLKFSFMLTLEPPSDITGHIIYLYFCQKKSYASISFLSDRHQRHYLYRVNELELLCSFTVTWYKAFRCSVVILLLPLFSLLRNNCRRCLPQSRHRVIRQNIF